MSEKHIIYSQQFFVGKGNLPACLDVLRQMYGDDPQTLDLEMSLSLANMVFGYDKEGNAVEIGLSDDDGDSFNDMVGCTLLNIAPYVREGSFITIINGEPEEVFQYYFAEEQCEVRDLPRALIFPPEQEANDFRIAHDLLDGAGVPRRKTAKVDINLATRIRMLLEKQNPNEDRTS